MRHASSKYFPSNQDHQPKCKRTNMDVDGLGKNPIYGEIEEIEDEVQKRFKKFKKLDIVTDPPFDHHFIHSKKPTIKHGLCGSSLAEKLQQEWKTLETGLPDSILVRAYENRNDLMRAVVIGPPDTPHYEGLFFFDILFPSNYPSRPPKLFYRSEGLELNPNLKVDGKVCLTLLETGRLIRRCYECKTEKWDPKESNLLQVLDSIRCQVLNAKPYLNDPVRLDVFYESEVLKYNRSALMLTCEAMVRTLDNPPRHFEDFVAGHFRQKAHTILMNYKEHTDQSEGMTQLFLKLLRAFEANGAYCKHHLSQVNTESESTEERSSNNGIVTRVFSRVKYLADSLA